MGIRDWIKSHAGGGAAEGVARHALGEYTAETYPDDVVDLLRRRQQVADELLAMNITDRQTRLEAIPRLRELLRIYPHALVYETLIQAYLDAGRYDEAKGVAFAACERRRECERSELPELRAEVDYLHEWSTEEVDRIREERTGGGA